MQDTPSEDFSHFLFYVLDGFQTGSDVVGPAEPAQNSYRLCRIFNISITHTLQSA
jgi:hypothetical protein